MIFVCPIYSSLKHDELYKFRSIIEEILPEATALGTLGCKSWGEVLLTYYSDELGIKRARLVLDELSDAKDNDDIIASLLKLNDNSVESLLVGIEAIRSVMPEKKIDLKTRPLITEEFELLPQSLPELDLNELVKETIKESNKKIEYIKDDILKILD